MLKLSRPDSLLIPIVAGIVAVAGLWFLAPVAAVSTSQSPDANDDRLKLVMETKLKGADALLRGLVTQDFEAVQKAAESMKLLSLDAPSHWKRKPGDDEIYEHFRLEFQRLCARIEEEAAQKRLAGAAWFQQQLTANCIACHDYLRDKDR